MNNSKMPNCCPSFCSKRSTISNYFIKSSHYQKLSGTSFGYSTIYLAEAARANSGRVTTLDYDVAKQVQASAYIQQVGLQEVVDFKLGDAMELLDGLPGHWDFVSLDLWKHLYIPCFDRVYEKLAPGAIVIADDVIFPPELRQGMQTYQDYVRAKPDLDSVEVGIGHGLEVTRKHQAVVLGAR
ncbi:MAG: hypothetical protein F6K28_00455 [Microcoleus sp. SIO2G3]|nr:hypothetical protein [Microcoleus sp. SIO2G3]